MKLPAIRKASKNDEFHRNITPGFILERKMVTMTTFLAPAPDPVRMGPWPTALAGSSLILTFMPKFFVIPTIFPMPPTTYVSTVTSLRQPHA